MRTSSFVREKSLRTDSDFYPRFAKVHIGASRPSYTGPDFVPSQVSSDMPSVRFTAPRPATVALTSVRRFRRAPGYGDRVTRARAARSLGSLPLYQPVTRGYLGAAGDAKFVDVALADYSCSTTGSLTHLDIVPQGTTVNSREGKAFKVTGVHVKGFIQGLAATAITTASWALVWDYQPNKASTNIVDIFDSINATSFRNRDNAGRFKILAYRFNTVIGNTGGNLTDSTVRVVDSFTAVGPGAGVALCTSSDTTGVIGNRVSGALYLVTTGSNPVDTSEAKAVFRIRVMFSDV